MEFLSKLKRYPYSQLKLLFLEGRIEFVSIFVNAEEFCRFLLFYFIFIFFIYIFFYIRFVIISSKSKFALIFVACYFGKPPLTSYFLNFISNSFSLNCALKRCFFKQIRYKYEIV